MLSLNNKIGQNAKIHTLFKVFTAANLRVGLEDEQNSCKTDTAGASSLGVVNFELTMA